MTQLNSIKILHPDQPTMTQLMALAVGYLSMVMKKYQRHK